MEGIPTIKLIWMRVITAFIIFFALIASLVAGFFVVYIRTPVEGMSMAPTLNMLYQQTGNRDMVYINRFNKGKVGDIVVLDLRNHTTFGGYSIKRLIAGSGDIVNIQYDGMDMCYNLIVNGVIVDSRPQQIFGYNTYDCFTQYVQNHKADTTRISIDEHGNPNGIIIKQGEIYVLGDNWDVSKDSSLVGPISEKTLVGRVDMVVKSNKNEFFSVLKQIF